MLAISSSPLFSNNFGWLLEDPISHELNMTSAETSSESVVALQSLSQTRVLQHCDSNKFDQIINNGDQPDQMVKKLNHNASERDRRKKINTLYSTLRSLLPASDHAKKLSIPSTISRVLKYIQELQNEVERLIQKKEELISRTNSNKENSADFNKQKRRGGVESSSLVISASEVGDREVVIQISTLKINKGSFAEAVSELEDEGLLLLNSSCFETLEDRVFYTLHFQQVQGTMVVELDTLRDKLSSYFEKEDKLLPQ
ncbi:transcription factor ORG2-like isoform X1 [Nicotiana tabacum]|uniref:Transcription factor ORG2-like isoform X1 n=1 Tax=Nicotiana tabacum TaxID=4097 RepID=A0A1S4AEK6_TOBAC|nr:PREDICTED: transcription factor ORG2-like isoform X1 [Nicotiana tabacum]